MVDHLLSELFDSPFCRYLKGNPFHCDCNLEHLRLKLVQNNSRVIQDGESVQCSTPLQMHNKAVKSLSELCGKLKVKPFRSAISNSNWTEWSTIQGVIAPVISKSKITSTITP